MGTTEIEVRRLDAREARDHLDGLAAVIADCVQGGAGVSYMAPFTFEDGRRIFSEFIADVEAGGRLLLAAFLDGEVVGSVQVVFAWPPNQPHRADIAKLIVHSKARRRGVAELLMWRAEEEARAEGRWLLVLDTVTGDGAYYLYKKLGWNEVGEVPEFALYPDGRLSPTTFFWKKL